MEDKINEVDYRSSMRVQALQKYTHDRFQEEEQHCHQRINHHLNENSNYPGEHMKSQIQNWLEQKLEGYGHCLHHHHDDTALPNENIFSDIHETANGRLFKSRSDETLSQSDNHSGRYRKKEFYESRQEAMQQIRAWQVPSYSKDRSRLKVSDKPPSRGTGNRESEQHVPSRPHMNFDLEPPRQYPVEARVEVKSSNINLGNPPKQHYIDRNAKQEADNHGYMSMGGVQSHAAKFSNVPQPQVYQSQRPVPGYRGPVTHSTPKSKESNLYTMHSGLVRSQTDSVLSRNSPGTPMKQTVQNSAQESSTVGSNSHTYHSSYTGKTDMKPSYSDYQVHQVPRVVNSVKNVIGYTVDTGCKNSSTSDKALPETPKNVNAYSVDTGCKNSSSSDKALPETPKPTFTTFGYDDSLIGSNVLTNIPENQTYSSVHNSVNNVTSQGSNSSHSSRDEQNKTQLTDKSLFSSHNSQGSFGFSPSTQEDPYVEMKSLSPRFHQQTRSSVGLLETDLDYISLSKSHSEDRHLDSRPISRSPMPRSTSETCTALNSRPSPLLTPQQSNRGQLQSPRGQLQSPKGAPRIAPHTFYSSPAQSQTSSFMRTPEKPVPSPKPNFEKTPYPYASVGEVRRERVYTGNLNFKVQPKSSSLSATQNAPENVYTSVKGVQNTKTVNADGHPLISQTYYTQINDRSHVTNSNLASMPLEPRSKTAYQTYLTESQFVANGHDQRESSPNICNNSKEDSSSNPDSGYSSKIYGNRPGSVQAPSCGSTPSSSFSTERGLPSNSNSPYSQYSNTDYEPLPNRQYEDEVQTHVQSWYQRKLQETTQKVYDSWRSERTLGHPQPLPQQAARYPRNGECSDYATINRMHGGRDVHDNGGISVYDSAMPGQQYHIPSTYVMHGSDV